MTDVFFWLGLAADATHRREGQDRKMVRKKRVMQPWLKDKPN